MHCKECEYDAMVLQAELEDVAKELLQCRNELCLKCGRYTERHKGYCDGCRWKDMSKWSR